MNKGQGFGEFAEVSAKQWKQKIQYDLKGADYNEELVWESPEGIKVKPFYHREDLEGLRTLPPQAPRSWEIVEPVYGGDLEKAGARAHGLLKKGAEGLLFTLPEATMDPERLLAKVDLEAVPLYFDLQFLDPVPIAALVSRTADHKGGIHMALDPIGQLVRSGNWYQDQGKDFGVLGEILALPRPQGGTLVGIHMDHYQNAGAHAVQQLAYGLAHAHEYLHHFAGTVGAHALKPCFKVAIGGNYFFEIAKLRALRWLWDSLSGAYSRKGDCQILAMPSRRNKTLYDYNVNLLRTNSECMSAVLGGADAICNLPYDALYHKENAFGRRIARNQLLLLREEGHFNGASHVADGAYYIESLTEQLAQRALELFKGIEASGGFLSALKKGSVQQKIRESAAKEQDLFDRGELVLLGTNRFQNPGDRMKGELQLHPFVKKRGRKTLIEPIVARRLAEGSEQKRLEDE